MARELTGLITRPGKPRIIVSDNGAEFTSHAIFAWAKDGDVPVNVEIGRQALLTLSQ